MKNFIQNGDTVTVTAPAGGVASGEGAVIGNLFGVAAFAAAAGESVELVTRGVFTLPKNAASVIAAGARVSWNAAVKQIELPGTGFYPVGVAAEATVNVRLDGISTAAA